MNQPIPITEAREHLGDLASRVLYGHERIILKRHNRCLALVPIEDLLAIEALENQEDIKAADAAMREIKKTGTISWSAVKEELGLTSVDAKPHRPTKKNTSETKQRGSREKNN